MVYENYFSMVALYELVRTGGYNIRDMVQACIYYAEHTDLGSDEVTNRIVNHLHEADYQFKLLEQQQNGLNEG